MKIGVMFGNPETTPGGQALKFFSSIRLDIRRKEQIKKGEEIVGNRVKVKVVKNKVAPPFRTTEFDLMYNEGISKTGEVLDIGVEVGVVSKSGAHYSFGKTKLGQGREATKLFLKTNPKIFNEIEEKIKMESEKLANVTALAVEEETVQSAEE